ncbi:hypothetical protein AGMMS50267_15250 [Spirochaetia bacterium]|nr:hypothetical protein AGMMS50267_15250 [Spirochaetia bacterium]
MKRDAFIELLEQNGVIFFKHGKEHDIYRNEKNVDGSPKLGYIIDMYHTHTEVSDEKGCIELA